MPYKNKEDRKANQRKRYSTPEAKQKYKEYCAIYREKNRTRIRQSANEWAEKNKSVVIDYVLKRRYGITDEAYKAMIEKQNGCCAICNAHHSLFTKRLHVDHCHKTNEIRGLLCVNCNTALGHFKENGNLIQEAISGNWDNLPVDSKKGMSKFCGNIDFMNNAIKYLSHG
jgi:hypothetical protein